MKKIIATFFCTAVLLSFVGCFEKETAKDGSVHVARYVSYTPSRIFPDQSIDIEFISSVTDVTSTGTKIDMNIFDFDPEIEGEAIWKSDRMISFVPAAELTQGGHYKAVLKLSGLDIRYKDVADYDFEFSVYRRDVISFTGDVKGILDKKIRYEADLIFNYKTDIEELKKAVTLTMNGNDFKFELLQGADKASFKLVTAEFTQSLEKKLFYFKIDKTNTGMASDFIREFSFTTKEEMEVVQVSRKTDSENPSVEILFASELSPDQDILGLIMVSPEVNFAQKKIGKSIILTGNFEYGKEYVITVNRNISNKAGFTLKSDYVKNIEFTDKPPKLEFADNGCFLSSGNDKKIRFNTQNIKEVQVKVKKVYETNLGQFLQRSSLKSSPTSSYYDYYDYYGYGDEFERVGIEIKKDTLKIAGKVNDMVVNEIDLSKLIPKNDKGLYVLELIYKEENTLYRKGEGYSPWDGRYPALNGKAEKNIIFSDLGISYIKSDNGSSVYVFDLETANPVNSADVKLLDFQNQVLKAGKTDHRGRITFEKTQRAPFYVTAERNNERSIIKLNEMQVNFSAFDIGGEDYSADKTRGYLYTDRGVYRPGDQINISMIFRNNDDTYPKDHPVKVKITNPLNKVAAEEIIKKGEDGFYKYTFITNPEDMTGTWNMTAEAGGQSFYKPLSIETVVPEMLDVSLKADKDSLSVNDTGLKIDIASKYLFGNPASNLRASVNYNFYGREKGFKKYPNYFFGNETLNFTGTEGTVFSGTLDKEGKHSMEFNLPKLTQIPSAASIKFSAEVMEEGGRPNKSRLTINCDPYDAYIGLERKQNEYIRAGSELELKTVLLALDGYPLQGREMEIKIYYNERYWWWDYSGRDSRMNFRSDFETRLVHQEDFISSNKPYSFKYNFREDGLYLIEVSQKASGTHSAAYFIQSSYWGDSDKDINSADFQALKTDRSSYEPGQTAIVKFPTPEQARVLVSFDKGSENIDSYSFTAQTNESKIEIPIKSSMIPNIYCTVSVIQPNSKSDNDRPVRIIGTIPVNVTDPKTKQDLKITVPAALRPNEKFKLQINAGEETQFTVAVVDQGLLSITDFISPDAWKFFNKKLRLRAGFYDLYGFVIGANRGPAANTFSIGGSLAERAKMLSEVNAQRFKPVSLFKGPLKTDKNGNAEVEFTMPEYVGAVRIMAVSAKNGKYGSFEKQVPVKTELIAMPSIPRTLAPGDEFDIPITVFSMDAEIKEAEVKIELSGALTTDEKPKTVKFSGIENKTVNFRVRAKDQTGVSKIKFTVQSGKYKYESNTEIAVKSLSPREFKTVTKMCEKGKSVDFTLADYLDGTVNSSVTVSKIKLPDIYRRMNYLIGYPYGCLEQTVTKGFSQLSVKPLLKQNSSLYEEIDKNINSAISKLRTFQDAGGSFNYWPGSSSYYSGWSDIYAGHFITEAKKKGYFVPADMFDNWKRSSQSAAIKYKVSSLGPVMSRKNEQIYYDTVYMVRMQIYRLYVLALAGDPEIGAMNIMKETNLPYLDDTEKMMLAVSYKYAGVNETAKTISGLAGTITDNYIELSGTFGSAERDKAVILTGLCEMGNEAKAAELYSNLVDEINSDEWFSTQSLGFIMLSFGKFMEKYPGYFNSNAKLSGIIKPSSEKEAVFTVKETSFTQNFTKVSKNITVSVDQSSQLEKCFISLNYDGIPLKPADKREGKGLVIERTFITGSVKPDASVIPQGETFKLKIKVKKTYANNLSNMALVQIIPSGWEIENKRLENASAYTSASSTKSGYYSNKTYQSSQYIRYTDIRDDRVMWFFDMAKDTKEVEFEIDLRAVSPGKFYLSPTIAESMYSKDFYALEPGMKVEVIRK